MTLDDLRRNPEREALIRAMPAGAEMDTLIAEALGARDGWVEFGEREHYSVVRRPLAIHWEPSANLAICWRALEEFAKRHVPRRQYCWPVAALAAMV